MSICNFEKGQEGRSSSNFECKRYNTVSKTLADNNESCYNSPIEEEDHMSFAGFSFVKGKIFMFSDSKGTIINDNGEKLEDYDREPVKKGFFNGKIAITSTGVASATYFDENSVLHTQDISEWLDSHIASYNDPAQLVCALFLWLQQKKCVLVHPIYIYGVYKRKQQFADSIAIASAVLDSNQMEYKIYNISQNIAYYSGDKNFLNYFNAHTDQLLIPNVDAIKRNIEDDVKEMDLHCASNGEYNSVGEEIVVEEIVL